MSISRVFSRKFFYSFVVFSLAFMVCSARVVAQGENSRSTENAPEKRLRFSFRYAPWKEVLDWFAEEAGYSLTLETSPAGTFNYTDSRTYTPAESIDILNSVLLTKGYTLVRRERMLILINVEDGVPPNLVEHVTPEELDNRGEYELVSCVFQLQRMTPEEADEEIKKLIGRQGAVIVLPKARQVYVTETAGKLRTIRDMIQAVEDPTETGGSTSITQLPLTHISPDEAILVIRQIMGIEEEKFSTEDGSLTLSMDALGTRLLAKATPDSIAEIRDILKLIDVPLENAPAAGGVAAAPQLEVYSISNADPDSVLQVMQTLMAGLPDVRMSLDPKTNNLIALARPAQQQTIRATLAQLQREYNEIEVIQLNVLDPATAKLAVQSLFGIDPDAEETTNAGPRVDANATTRQLLVRGTRAEIDRIKTLLEKMGEDEQATLMANADRGNVRMLPMTGTSAQALLERARQVWPTIRGNRIRTVTPSAAVNAMRRSPSDQVEESPAPTDETRGGVSPSPSDIRRFIPRDGRLELESEPHRTSEDELIEPTNAAFSQVEKEIVFLARADDTARAEDQRPKTEDPQTHGPTDSQTHRPTDTLSDIVVAPGPSGLLIASDDLDALDAFEELLNALSDPMLFPNNDYTVFYLKFAKADLAAKLLNDLVSGTGGAAANALTGAAFGNLLDAAASALETSGPLQIVPDTRINALIVQGESGDVDLIRQLLTIIDQEHSPENVQITAPPRLIPIFNASATDVATVVKDIYASRMAGARSRGNGQRDRQDIEQMIDEMRSGRGGRGGPGGRGGSGGQQADRPEPDLTVGVDARSNSLIVSAPEPLFQEIKALVSQLDEVAIESNEITRVVTVTQANPESIQKALGSLFGGQVAGSSQDSNSAARNGSSNTADAARRNVDAEAQDRMRRRLEFFNAMQRGGGFGRGGRPGGFGRGGDGGGRGGGDRGGGDRDGR